MADPLEGAILMGAALSAALLIVILLLVLRNKAALISERGKTTLKEAKKRYFGLLTFGVASAGVFIAIEFLEAKEALAYIYGVVPIEVAPIEDTLIFFHLLFLLLAELMILMLVWEAKSA